MKTFHNAARNLTIVGLLTLLVVILAHGQTETVLSANVPFGFEAGDTLLPAGTYQFKLNLPEESLVISGAKPEATKVHIIAKLAGASLFQDTGLVFNVFQHRHVLAEVWMPGQGGVLINNAPEKHSNQMVTAVVSGASPKMSGKEVYDSTCARCHGPMGKGNPMADKFFKTSIPRLDSEYVQKKSDEELKDIISHGRRNMDPVRIGQASVQHLLYPESVNAVVKYVRTFKQE